jgi:hypothetical protein
VSGFSRTPTLGRLKPATTSAFAALCCLLASAQPAFAQRPTGTVGLFADYFPNRHDTTELRARLFVEEKLEPTPKVVVTASGFVEGLLSRRAIPGQGTSLSSVNDAIVRVMDANVQIFGGRVDFLAGYARIPWGKLDEIQPTDVINPLDVSRFFFEGRSEARVPMLLARARLRVSDDVSVDAVYLPDFRRGRFDQLDEPSSPFNLPLNLSTDPAICAVIGCELPLRPPIDRSPAFTIDNAQGGVRLSATSGRVDWSVSAFRGFETFGFYTLEGDAPVRTVALEYPRFTMIGSDFEAVLGQWGVRGELAAFVDDNFQTATLDVVRGHSFDAGIGVDRRAGDYTVSGTVLVHREAYDEPVVTSDRTLEDGRTDVSLVASADRTFDRERYRLRTFGVYNLTEESAFVRAIGMATLRDNLLLEASIGWFLGEGRDLVGRFGDSDFVYLRAKYYF